MEDWKIGAERICEAMQERSPREIRRLTETVYESLMNDVQDYLRENVEYNLAGELSMRDREIETLKAEKSALVMALTSSVNSISTMMRRGWIPSEHMSNAGLIHDSARAALAQVRA